MPDPLPSVTSSSLSIATVVSGSQNPGHSGPFVDSSSLLATSRGSTSSTLNALAEETPVQSSLWTGGSFARLQSPHNYNFKDDMEVFSPLVEIQPLTPSLVKLWDDRVGVKEDHLAVDKKPSLYFPSSWRFPPSEEWSNDLHPIFDWKSNSNSKQDDTCAFSPLGSTPTVSSKSGPSITPPEAWGGEKLSDKFIHHCQPTTLPYHFSMLISTSLTSGSMFSGLQDLPLSTGQTSMSLVNLRSGDNSNLETDWGISEHVPFSSTSLSLCRRDVPSVMEHPFQWVCQKLGRQELKQG